jgi:hypothetical protein
MLCWQSGGNHILLRAPKRIGPALTTCVGMAVGMQTREPSVISSDLLWPPPPSMVPIPDLYHW